MSFEPDLIQRPSIGSTDGLFTPGLFFAPPQQPDAPSPELFDQELAELDLYLPFEQFDELFTTTFHDFSPVTPTPLTDSTICVYGASHYSPNSARPDYSISSEVEIEGYGYCSLNNGLYGTHVSMHSAIFSNGPPSAQSLDPAEAQFNFGTSTLGPNFLEIPPEDLSIAMQPPTGTPLPVHRTSDLEVQMAPAPDRPFKCSHPSHCKAETI